MNARILIFLAIGIFLIVTIIIISKNTSTTNSYSAMNSGKLTVGKILYDLGFRYKPVANIDPHSSAFMLDMHEPE